MLKTEALHHLGPDPHFCLGWSLASTSASWSTIAIAEDVSKAFGILPLLADDLWHTSTAGRPRAFTSSTTRGPKGLSSSQHSLTPLYQIVKPPIQTCRPMPMTSLCWFLLLASWSLRRGQTICDIGEACKTGGCPAMGPCSSEIQRDALHPGHPPVPAPPQVRIRDVVAQLNRTPKILGVTLDTHFTFGPHARDCVDRVCEVSQCHESPSWIELGLHNRNLGGHLQGYRERHPELLHPCLFYPNVLSLLDKIEVIQ